VDEGDKVVVDDDASAAAASTTTEKRLDLDHHRNHLAVPAGAVARLEAAPLGPADVPLTARSCRISVTVPKTQSSAEGKTSPSGAVSRAIPQGGAAATGTGAGAGAGATATATATPTLPPPPPASWRAAAASIASCAQASLTAGGGPPSIVVVGPKNVGKSSFARLLANELMSCCRSPLADDSTRKDASASSPPAVVAWCDADCGQPELTPPGLVSLSHLSRPLLAGGGSSGGSRSRSKSSSSSSSENGFSLRRPPHRAAWAHFLGALSPASDPDRACATVSSLLRWHWQHGVEREETEKNSNNNKKKKTAKKPLWPPLVVNTPGWVRGAGLDLLRATLAAARPTHVVRLSTGNGERDAPQAFELFEGGNLPPLLEVVELPALTSNKSNSAGGDGDDDDEGLAPPPSSSLFQGIFPTSCAANSSRYSAADARTALWFAFARSCVESAAADDDDDNDDEEETGEKETSNSSSLDLFLPAALAAARPMTLPLSSIRLEFLGERPSSPSNALRVLNGSVVALTTAAEAGRGLEDDDDDDDDGGNEKEEEELAFSRASPSPTVSLALVRGIDGKRGLLHLLCPLRSAELASAGVVALQVGSALELPPALLAGGIIGGGLAAASARNSSSSKTTPVAVSSSPYLAPWCLAAGGTGARATKARNDLARGGGGGGGARN